MTRTELLARTSSAELAQWQAFERVEGPLGGARADVHTALICSVIANGNRNKGDPVRKPAEFIPKWGKRYEPGQSPDQQWAVAQQLNAKFGGELVEASEQGR